MKPQKTIRKLKKLKKIMRKLGIDSVDFAFNSDKLSIYTYAERSQPIIDALYEDANIAVEEEDISYPSESIVKTVRCTIKTENFTYSHIKTTVEKPQDEPPAAEELPQEQEASDDAARD